MHDDLPILGGIMEHSTSRVAALAGTAALAAGACLWPSIAGAAQSGHPSGGVISSGVVTGQFVSDRTEEAFVNNDTNPQPTLGDELVYTNSGRGPLGAVTDYGRCTLHEVDRTAVPAAVTLACTATSKIGRDSITLQGTTRATLVPAGEAPRLLEPSRWAVTGGTGPFARARGDVVIDRFTGTGLDFRTFGRIRLVLAP